MKGIIPPPTSEITLGKAIHSTLNANYRQKIKTGKDLPLQEMLDIFSDEWDRRAPATRFSPDEAPSKIKDEGVRLIKTYQESCGFRIRPAAVEKAFAIKFERLDKPLIGYIDLIDKEGVIIDHKTTKRSWQEEKVRSDLQLTSYALAYRRMTGKKEKGLRYDVLVRTKTPKIQQLETERGSYDFKRLEKLAYRINRAINSAIFYPNENYTCKTCGYLNLCTKW